jgi:hypothetical protein
MRCFAGKAIFVRRDLARILNPQNVKVKREGASTSVREFKIASQNRGAQSSAKNPPKGSRSFLSFLPALTGWANLCRAYGVREANGKSRFLAMLGMTG